jgi:hypothetical protein
MSAAAHATGPRHVHVHVHVCLGVPNGVPNLP